MSNNYFSNKHVSFWKPAIIEEEPDQPNEQFDLYNKSENPATNLPTTTRSENRTLSEDKSKVKSITEWDLISKDLDMLDLNIGNWEHTNKNRELSELEHNISQSAPKDVRQNIKTTLKSSISSSNSFPPYAYPDSISFPNIDEDVKLNFISNKSLSVPKSTFIEATSRSHLNNNEKYQSSQKSSLSKRNFESASKFHDHSSFSTPSLNETNKIYSYTEKPELLPLISDQSRYGSVAFGFPKNQQNFSMVNQDSAKTITNSNKYSSFCAEEDYISKNAQTNEMNLDLERKHSRICSPCSLNFPEVNNQIMRKNSQYSNSKSVSKRKDNAQLNKPLPALPFYESYASSALSLNVSDAPLLLTRPLMIKKKSNTSAIQLASYVVDQATNSKNMLTTSFSEALTMPAPLSSTVGYTEAKSMPKQSRSKRFKSSSIASNKLTQGFYQFCSRNTKPNYFQKAEELDRNNNTYTCYNDTGDDNLSPSSKPSSVFSNRSDHINHQHNSSLDSGKSSTHGHKTQRSSLSLFSHTSYQTDDTWSKASSFVDMYLDNNISTSKDHLKGVDNSVTLDSEEDNQECLGFCNNKASFFNSQSAIDVSNTTMADSGDTFDNDLKNGFFFSSHKWKLKKPSFSLGKKSF